MLLDEIKARMFRAMKEKREVEKEILRVAVGEITTEAARPCRKGDDAEATAIVRRLQKSVEETLATVQDDAQRATLKEELEILASLLPKALGLDEIVAALAPVAEAIRAASGDGPATGIAMKHLKGAGISADGKLVSEAVKRVRAA
jgi:uncharacterized protein YqeY